MDPILETVDFEGSSSLKHVQVGCTAFQENHRWHYHPEYELTLIERGEGTRFIGDSVEHFDRGDLVLIGPDIPHCWHSDKPADSVGDDPHQSSEMIVVQFRDDVLGAGFLDTPEATKLKTMLMSSGRGIHFSDACANEARRLIKLLQNSSELERLANFILLMNHLVQAETKQLLASELYVTDNSEFHGGRLANVMSYVRENLGADIKQADVAELVCMTPQSFSRFFRKTTGRTFVSFVNVLRVNQACRLLANTNRDIVDIAFECGYCNLSNFNRRFADIKKTTPSRYRKSHRLNSRMAS